MPTKAKYIIPNQAMLTKQIGDNIAHIRKKRGLTQQELAEKIGITQKLLSHYETGKLRIASEMLFYFASILNVTADEILGLKKAHGNTVGQETRLKIIRRLKKLETLPEHQQKVILRSLDMMLNSTH
jgi:transcriptional regulator with XRE-family HTH domain